ncbi:MAG: HAD family phosphatase [Lachnospiraceae bacterium]|nr:HAD family phosphatase [Lachnospiraceae bacterium]
MIKNVVFDIGGVLLEYRWRDLLKSFGATDEEAEAVAGITFSDPAWRAMDRGEMSLDETREYFVKTYPDHGYLLDCFLSHPEGMPVDRPAVWEKMRLVKEAGYRIYILSNYGEELFRCHVSGKEFMSYPDGVLVSYEDHVCKPDRRIYEILVERFGLVKEECIFFDDMLENVESAIGFGMQSVQILSQQVILDELDRLLEGKR